MKEKILITDSLFIFAEHEKMLTDAGYEIERLDKPEATEAELIEAVKGKTGYILGGIEHITDKVINAGDMLKVIVFTGSDWRHFIPGHPRATERGIAIANAPGANSSSVAEYTLALMLAMTRNIFELGRTGAKKFKTEHSLTELTVGIVGMGKIGSLLAERLHALGVPKIVYYSRTRNEALEQKLGMQFLSLDQVLSQSDIVSLHVSKEAGNGFITKEGIASMKKGALLINCCFPGVLDREALFTALESGALRAAQDEPMDDRFNALPLSVWFNSNMGTAYNTFEANKKGSDMAIESIINLLKTGKDQYKVN